METVNTQMQIDDINRKLDIILKEIEMQRRHRREIEDLKDDLMRVGADLYKTAVDELEEVHDSFQPGDVIFLGKKLLRNVKTLTGMFEQVESVRDFLQDFSPISRELAIDFMNRMNEFDKKGYFEFAKELTKAVDNVVESFTVEDVEALNENIVTILNTVKNLTQPDMLQAVNNAVSVYKHMDIEVTDDISTMGLLRELNSPEARKGLAFAVRFLKNLAENQNENLTDIKTIQTN